MDDFISDEKSRIDNIVIDLTVDESNELRPEITFLKSLLDLLGKADLNKKEKKDIKKDIKKKVTKIEKEIKKNRMENIGSYTLTKNVQPNITEIPSEAKIEAQMVRASSIYYDTNNFEEAQRYLNENEIPFNIDTELSDKQGLVLHNAETNESKIAFRGTKFSDINDWKIDAQILTGNEAENPQVIKAKNQVKNIVEKYGAKPTKTIGYSKGGKLAIMTADSEGLEGSTTFNTFLGWNDLNNTETSAKHTIYRTTEDLPSIVVGFKKNLKNYDIKTIRPHIDSLNPKKAHDLNNFISEKPRATSSPLEDSAKALMLSANRAGEAELIIAEKSHINNKTLIKKPGKVIEYDTTNSNPLVSHKFDKEHYSPESDLYDIIDNNPLSDLNSMERQLNLNYPSEEELNQEESYSNLYDEFGEHGVPIKLKPVEPEDFNTDDFISRMEQKMNAIKSDTPFGNPKHNMKPLNEIIEQPARQTLPVEVPLLIPEPSKSSYTEFVHDFNGKRGNDTIMDENGNLKLNSNRMHSKSRHGKIWKELGQDFTESEKAHFDYFDDVTSDDKFLLTENERNELYNANEEESKNILQDYHNDMLQKQENTDIASSIPDEVGDMHVGTNDAIRGMHPMNMGIGLLGNYFADKLVNLYDPLYHDTNGYVDESKQKLSFGARSALTGGLGGVFSATALSALGQGAAELIPIEAVAGASGGYVGYKTYDYLKKKGLGENEASVLSGTAGGATAGAVSAAGAIAVGAATGAELGLPEAAFSFGTSIVIGSVIGAAIGEGSYLLGKYG